MSFSSSPSQENKYDFILKALVEHMTISATAPLKVVDINKAPGINDIPTWSDMIVRACAFRDLTRSHRFDAALSSGGTPRNQRDIFHCLLAAVRPYPAAHTELERIIPIDVLGDYTSSDTQHGTAAWRNIVTWISKWRRTRQHAWPSLCLRPSSSNPITSWSLSAARRQHGVL
jgi:hypothetical protein